MTINAGAGDQYDPQMNGNLAVYTDISSAGIRYYSFLTSTEQAVPTMAGTLDSLPDMFGNRISFSRQSADRQALMVYDTTTAVLFDVAPQAGSSRVGSALGGDNVAFAAMMHNLTTGIHVDVSMAQKVFPDIRLKSVPEFASPA